MKLLDPEPAIAECVAGLLEAVRRAGFDSLTEWYGHPGNQTSEAISTLLETAEHIARQTVRANPELEAAVAEWEAEAREDFEQQEVATDGVQALNK